MSPFNRFSTMTGLRSDQLAELSVLLGLIFSFLLTVTSSLRTKFGFAILWFGYFSIYQVGQTFLWFQWDILLLEAGFLTIIVAPTFRSSGTNSHDNLTMYLVRWLLFRLMFQSGVVKLTSGCPTWWGLTALDWHYESQCIPTPASWYMHQLPHWFQRVSVVASFVIEIALPFLFFIPVRNLKLFAFWGQVILQVMIMISGNYTFFNLLTIVLCFSLLDDVDLGGKRSVGRVTRFCSWIVTSMVLAWLGYWTVKYFHLRIGNADNRILSEITFTKQDFASWLTKAVFISIYIGAIALAMELINSVGAALLSEKRFFSRIFVLLQTLTIGAVVVFMFCISLVPYASVDHKVSSALPSEFHKWQKSLEFLPLVHPYGLFRRMTGVGGRPEVVLEWSMDVNGPWREYDFIYKPGNLSSPLPFNVPHQPRLDWQLWFAALGRVNHNPWFLNTVYRLLKGQDEVLDLMDRSTLPDTPPTFIRAHLYTYHYTSHGSLDWWRKDGNSDIYLPPVSLKGPEFFKDYIKKVKLHKPVPVSGHSQLLDIISVPRKYVAKLRGEYLCWMCFLTSIALHLPGFVKPKIN